jgi:hypothetical protein
VSTIEDLLERKNIGSGLESREYGRGDPSGTLYPQKLALTSPTSGGLSVVIVRSRIQATEYVCFFCLLFGQFRLPCAFLRNEASYLSYLAFSLPYQSGYLSGIYSISAGQLPCHLKLHGLSPRANYTDRATAACRRSDCQLLRIEGATWSV